MFVLTLNAGSSSIKYKIYQIEHAKQTSLISGLIEGIGENQGAWHHTVTKKEQESHHFKNHGEAFTALANRLKLELKDHPIEGVGHRVVHGGNRYFNPTVITPEVLAEIRTLSSLAPIHNPINAEGIEFAQQHFPDALHVAIFDTGFHHTMPDYTRRYAINAEIADQYQIRRYGFHGINHEYVTKVAAQFLKKPLDQTHIISLHLGNGASACLVRNGQSVDTTMGLTPLAGLVMGTRCGDIDPAIVFYLQQQGMSVEQVDTLLNKQSGLKGIAHENDMRKLIARALDHDQQAILAIEMYVYSIQKTIGAYHSQAKQLDALVFTAGVGENSSFIREKVITPLGHLGFHLDEEKNNLYHPEKCHNLADTGIPILVIRGDEEALMAEKVIAASQGLF